MPRNAGLPRTSRVTEKIIEYYLKFGQERDLEKFMRLHSPCSNHASTGSNSPTTALSSFTSEEEGRVLRRLFLCGSEMSTDTEEIATKPQERTIPIVMLATNDTDKGGTPTLLKENIAASAPELQTPPSNQKQLQAKSPDSIAKSHRRLEWDSLGDVGYKRSMSTSNISVLERSLLKEFFQERTISMPATETDANLSGGESKQVKIDLLREEYRTVTKSTGGECSNYNTPPLASSTLMDVICPKNMQNSGARPKYISQGTSTSLQERFEKCAQTSIQRPMAVTSRQVQVTLSSATSSASSAVGGSATPSSFDYYSSRSSRSTANSSSASADKQMAVKGQLQKRSEPHPFVAGINEMLARRQAIAAEKRKNGVESIRDKSVELQQVHDTLKKAFSENKENSTTSLPIIGSPQLDLGVELLCSLIDARSLNEKQKKKLVRDIVKRISRLNIETDGSRVEDKNTSVAHENDASQLTSAPSSNQNTSKTSKSISTVTVARAARNSLNKRDMSNTLVHTNSLEEAETSKTTDHESPINKVNETSSLPTTSAKALAELAVKAAMKSKVHVQEKTQSSKTKPKSVPEKTKQTNKVTKPSISSSSSATSASSKDITTQKPVNKVTVNSSDTDAESAQWTMRDWLNPMTQSEIEYEEKKREFARNAAKRDRIIKCINSDQTCRERKSQLKWIETEIQRLESLRHLIMKPGDKNDQSNQYREQLHQHALEKLYDAVISDELISPGASSSTAVQSIGEEQTEQEIEVIIEESNEDVVKLNENLKRTKQRKRETQIVYDKPAELTDTHGNLLQGNARFRTIKETITTNEEQIYPVLESQQENNEEQVPIPPPRKLPPDPPQQRSKINTPYDSNEGESVRSFATQRKREFLEQYHNKKREHYESLLHRHQQLLIQQQQQIIQELQTRCNKAVGTVEMAHNGHYSVPQTAQRMCCHCNSQQHRCMQTEMQSLPKSTVLPREAQPTRQAAAKRTSKRQTTQETSSSSIFCISSEISIPMGSSTTSSSTTTTHQYDDVPGVRISSNGVGVQTTDSLRRSQPIFGPRFYWGHPNHRPPDWFTTNTQSIPSGQPICLQVKPKAIAYVIQFDSKTTTTTTTTKEISSSKPNGNIDDNSTDSRDNASNEHQTELCALQDYLERAKPEFCAHSKERKAILNQIQLLRQQRGQELRDIIENASTSSLDTRLERLPPPATKRIRIFPTKEMKAITFKHYKNLPEVLEKKERDREERRRNGNRLIRDIFNRRLQRRVRNGKLSLNHSRTVI